MSDLLPFEPDHSIDSAIKHGEKPEASFDTVLPPTSDGHWTKLEIAVFAFGVVCMITGAAACIISFFVNG